MKAREAETAQYRPHFEKAFTWAKESYLPLLQAAITEADEVGIADVAAALRALAADTERCDHSKIPGYLTKDMACQLDAECMKAQENLRVAQVKIAKARLEIDAARRSQFAKGAGIKSGEARYKGSVKERVFAYHNNVPAGERSKRGYRANFVRQCEARKILGDDHITAATAEAYFDEHKRGCQ
jgi:hypothetical protein